MHILSMSELEEGEAGLCMIFHFTADNVVSGGEKRFVRRKASLAGEQSAEALEGENRIVST